MILENLIVVKKDLFFFGWMLPAFTCPLFGGRLDFAGFLVSDIYPLKMPNV